MTKYFIVVIIILLSWDGIMAQPNLLSKYPLKQLERQDQGPNTDHWWSTMIQFGFTLPFNSNDSLGITGVPESINFVAGWRYKRRLNNSFSLGLDFGYAYKSFRISQSESSNLLSLGKVNKKQELRLHSFQGGAFTRINFGKRGNIIGKYLDVGGEISYHMKEQLMSKNDINPSQAAPGRKEKSMVNGLDFVKDIEYGVSARFGWNYISFFARYRMSDLFRPVEYLNGNRVLPELPRLMVGIEFSQSLN